MDNPANSIHSQILEWMKEVKFRKKLVGGVDEEDVLNKLEELNALYEAALLSEREKYESLLRRSKGGAENE